MARHFSLVSARRPSAGSDRGVLRSGKDGVWKERRARGQRRVKAVLGARFGREVWLGMFAPLIVVGATWVMTERVYRARPENLTSVMMAAFAGKLLFFGAYVAAAIAVFGVRPVRFA